MINRAGLQPVRRFQPVRTALYYAQRFAFRPEVRNPVARAIASAIRLQHGSGVLLEDGASDLTYRGLRTDGVARLDDDVIGIERAQRMLDFFHTQSVSVGDKLVRLVDVPPEASMVSYPLATILANADVRDIVTSPLMLDTAARYLGCRPTLSSLGVRWSFPTSKPPADTQRFHRDPDDWRFLKLFVYLTDVTSGTGPHIYVKGSHRTAGQLRSKFFDAPQLRSIYGPGSLEEITGPRGTAFVADTYGIHAGMVPRDAPRLILQAQYSLLPVFAFRYEAVAVENWSTRPDPYVSRLLATPL